MEREASHAPDRVAPVTPIEVHRRALRISQRTAAKRVGINRTTWSDLECGRRASPALQERVAALLGTTPAVLWPAEYETAQR